MVAERHRSANTRAAALQGLTAERPRAIPREIIPRCRDARLRHAEEPRKSRC